MGKKLWGFVFILIVLVGALVFFLNRDEVDNSPEIDLEVCNVISEPSSNGVNMVFFGSEDQARSYSDYLLEFSPFNNFKNDFNFYYIDSYEPECEIYKGIALLCHSKELIKKAGACPNDYIIVLKSEKSNIRSSNYMNVMSINTAHSLSVFPHEFGHSFLSLAEEYTPGRIPKRSNNCVASCSSFDGLEDGCFEGCSESNFYRSIDRGVMRTLSSDSYGSFNEKSISDKLSSKYSSGAGITGNVVSEVNCADQSYYLIEGIFSDGGIDIIDKTKEKGCQTNGGSGDFSYNLVLNDGSVLSGEDFNPDLIFTDAPLGDEIDGETFESDRPFLLKIPFNSNSDSLHIFDSDDNLVKEVSLYSVGSEFCRK